MDFTGRVIVDIPMEEGVSRAGNAWRKKCWVLETFGPYPKKVKIDVFGRNVDSVHLEMGKIYNVSVDAESREFNGRWYTDLSCYAARETEQPPVNGGYAQPAPTAAPAAPAAAAFPPASANPFPPAGGDPFAAAPGAAGGSAFEDASDDLPF